MPRERASSVPALLPRAPRSDAHHPATRGRRNCAMSLILFRVRRRLPGAARSRVAARQPRERRQPGVNPPRPVWERSELSRPSSRRSHAWSRAAGRAMIDELPQLAGGCVNYWEAGNWALNDEAEPRGRKDARTHRQMHLHLLGRSPTSTDPAWAWGESPRFPMFAERHSWAARFERLTVAECTAIVGRTDALLRDKYAPAGRTDRRWSPCEPAAIPRRSAVGECASG